MRRLLVGAVALLVALAAPAVASAHPLGNFTVNRYAEIRLSGEEIFVRYALDLAEIPAFQEGGRVRGPGFTSRLAEDLVLTIDGERARLSLVAARLATRPGAGGLETIRLDAVYESDRSGRALRFEDRTFEGRIGWREVVVTADRGAAVREATVPSKSASDALRSYPQDLLESPLAVSSARVSFQPGKEAGVPPALGETRAVDRETGGFEALVNRGDLGAGVVLVSLGLAMFWGAAHALTPGHGKAIVAGYLVGSRARPRDALVLGAIVTVAHTAGVFALGFVTLLLSRFVVPELLYPWLTLVSGVLVVAVGAAVLWKRLRHRVAHRHVHGRGHAHERHHDHGVRGLAGVGIAAGLLPCPSALVVLLSAIALHRIGLGLALIVAFSFGLALTITSIGLLAVLARRAFTRLRLDGAFVRALPAASALLILALGVGITVKALPEVL
jgi:nickel/cobalt transporter (NicO) family protein